MLVKVLGPGCASCKKLYKVVLEAVEEIGSNIKVEHINDVEKMMLYGVMSPPALVIDEKVILQGRVPSKVDLKKIIQNGSVAYDSDSSKSECSCSGNC